MRGRCCSLAIVDGPTVKWFARSVRPAVVKAQSREFPARTRRSNIAMAAATPASPGRRSTMIPLRRVAHYAAIGALKHSPASWSWCHPAGNRGCPATQHRAVDPLTGPRCAKRPSPGAPLAGEQFDFGSSGYMRSISARPRQARPCSRRGAPSPKAAAARARGSHVAARAMSSKLVVISDPIGEPGLVLHANEIGDV